jgi:hypothetical protein
MFLKSWYFLCKITDFIRFVVSCIIFIIFKQFLI